MAVPFIRDLLPTGSDINIMCDSQAAILALEEVDTKSLGVKHCKNELSSLGRTHNITINWIKAHVNHKGNELADRAAKTGAQLQESDDTPLSNAYVKTLINDALYRTWDRR